MQASFSMENKNKKNYFTQTKIRTETAKLMLNKKFRLKMQSAVKYTVGRV